MADVSALKTEIKTWERSFRAKHGREPSVQDIKNQPDLAEKYRQYKKLSKSAAAQATKPPNPPSTPPRDESRPSAQPSLLLPKPRSIAAAQPLSGFNPFSPQKSKGKQKEWSPDPHSRPNPFQITSLVPFSISSTSTAAKTSDPFAQTPNDAISRARKRLRGEPVSPSPNKEKRRRMLPSHESDDEDDEEGAGDTSFVDDSPAKPPNGVRSFKLLFDEGSTKPKFPSLLRTKTAPPGLFGFGDGAPRAESSENMDIDEVVPRSPEKLAPFASLQDDPFSEETAAAVLDHEMADDRKPDAARRLLAPSPPPAARRPSGPHLQNAKGKGKPTNKADIMSEEEDGSDEDALMNGKQARHKVRLFDRTASRGIRDGDSIDEPFITARRPPDEDIVQSETSETISLPDTLLSILSLAPVSSHGRQDEHVVDQLIYGARRGNYDPSKGGEIWGVGEFEEEDRDEFALDTGRSRTTRGVYDDEDDWEGEGVPWEVGEL
ncbi:hypothetical protein DFH08DRAFT_375734 [Mycena albidolilacea]|uniref:DNA replication regulator SLD2 n=1 Tax=Mycena albidolilacea TaxID=1033008 RepID=A0AAD7AL05_9AGAR|nr:hypothetical protein DFH08DRAFT_375734 [Mycena albidolilacea]